MNILLTGHRGYIGKSIKKKFSESNYNIKTITNRITTKSKINYENIDCVIHCLNKFNCNNKNDIFKTNYIISKKIFDEIIKVNSKRIKIFININTIKIKENSNFNNNYYVTSKKKFSCYVEKKTNKKILFIDFLVPTVFGNKGNGKDFYSEAFVQLKKNKELKIKSPHISKKFIKINNLTNQVFRFFKKYKNSSKTGYLKIIANYNFEKTVLEFTNYLKIKLKSKSKISY